MIDRLRARLAAVLPTLRALGQWLALAGLTGLACGGAGAAFTWCVAKAAALRAAHPWLLFLMPLAGLAIVFSYRAAGMENDSGTNPFSFTHLRAHGTPGQLGCRSLLENKKTI